MLYSRWSHRSNALNIIIINILNLNIVINILNINNIIIIIIIDILKNIIVTAKVRYLFKTHINILYTIVIIIIILNITIIIYYRFLIILQINLRFNEFVIFNSEFGELVPDTFLVSVRNSHHFVVFLFLF